MGQFLSDSRTRIRIWHGLLIAVFLVFGLRLFYIQVVRYGHYKDEARSDQLRQYEIAANRGIIKMHNGDTIVPLVLNQQLYSLVVDPTFVKKPQKYADEISKIIGGQPSDYMQRLTVKKTHYSVLAKKLNKAQRDALMALKLPGLVAEEVPYRIYPHGQLASQVLGFVNAEGKGTYGIEQALQKELGGTSGLLKATTDVHGVPLAANKDNIQRAAVAGNDIVLSLDMAMQTQMEKILKQKAEETRSEQLSAVIMDPKTGKVKAMANYPTFDPSKINEVEDPSVFQNAAVSHAIEPGSIVKPLTAAAAINQRVVGAQTTYYDPAKYTVNGYTITNIEEDGGARTQSVGSILYLSLNTGATWLVMQMGGGQINAKAISSWHEYMTAHFLFGAKTGIEQGYESAGYIPPANVRKPAIALTYANSSFGQGMTMTAVQAAAALSAVVNGGTYYQPSLVDYTVDAGGAQRKVDPKVVKKNIVSPQTSAAMIPLMEAVVKHYNAQGFRYMNFDSAYSVGGKTGTAQIAKPGGGYDEHNFNGTYMGFVGGDTPEYVIAVFNHKPQVTGYAGSRAGQPVFADLAHMLINNGFVTPK